MSPDPVTRDELIAAFDVTRNEVSGYFSALDLQTFTASPPGRWSPAQHLDHLIRANAPVAAGLGLARAPLPRLAARLGLTRGRLAPAPAGRVGRTYAALRDAYRAALAAGAKASGPYLPQQRSDQDSLVQDYRRGVSTLQAALARWPDAGLDRWLARHPILGDLSVRELLYFTLYHNRHHLDGVQDAQRELASAHGGAR